jgi:hypothetical protein
VHGDGLADDEAIFDELADCLSRVGVADFALFVGVEPDLALAAAHDGRGEALLGTEVDPIIIVHVSFVVHDASRRERCGAIARRRDGGVEEHFSASKETFNDAR